MICPRCQKECEKIVDSQKYEKCCKKCMRRIYQTACDKKPENIEKRRKYHREWKKTEKARAYKKKYRQRPEIIKRENEQGLRYYYRNREKMIQNTRNWEKRNREKVLIRNRRYSKERRKNPLKNLGDRMRQCIKKVFVKNGISKKGRTFEYLSYTPKELYEYLSTYLNKPCEDCKACIITKESYSLDHVYPLCMAKTQEEIIELNKLNNLRLICFNCNCKKNDLIIESLLFKYNLEKYLTEGILPCTHHNSPLLN